MSIRALVRVTCAAALLAVCVAGSANAQPLDRRTNFTFRNPTSVPGVTLAPGEYQFRVIDSYTRDVVQVLSADGMKPYAMFFTIPLWRPDPAKDSELAFMETAAGMPQADDVTAVLVQRRARPEVVRTFERSFEALPALAEFTAETFATLGLGPEIRGRADFVLEELFTNMVKYGRGSAAPIRVGVAGHGDGAMLTLVDRDVDRFDVTAAPDVDTGRSIDEREPGGLGLHLIRKLADRIAYEYADASRESRITVWLNGRGEARAGASGRGGTDAGT